MGGENKEHGSRFLAALYREQISRNAKFSVRAFARQLEIPAGRVSELLSGKRRLTTQLAKKISDRLKLDEDRRAALFADVLGGDSARAAVPHTEPIRTLLDEARLAVIADPLHFAILGLMRTRGFRMNEVWIGDRLGVSPKLVRQAVNRLRDLELIAMRRGKWVRTTVSIGTSDGPSSVALRLSHRRSLEQAIQTIEGVSPELRDLFSITLAIDAEKLPQARRRIRQFAESLETFLENGIQNEVYNLNIQLVPLSRETDV